MAKPTPITVKGIEYPSLTAAAKAHRVNSAMVNRRLKAGWDVDRAFTEPRMSYSEAGQKGKNVSGWHRYRRGLK